MANIDFIFHTLSVVDYTTVASSFKASNVVTTYSNWFDVRGAKSLGVFWDYTPNLGGTGSCVLTVQQAPDPWTLKTVTDYHCLNLKLFKDSTNHTAGTFTTLYSQTTGATGVAPGAQYRVSDMPAGYIRFKTATRGTTPNVAHTFTILGTKE